MIFLKKIIDFSHFCYYFNSQMPQTRAFTIKVSLMHIYGGQGLEQLHLVKVLLVGILKALT